MADPSGEALTGLLTVVEDGTGEGRLLPGTVSFICARMHAAPAFGNLTHWAAGLPTGPRTTPHSPKRISAATEKAFHLRFLAQSAAPDAQMTTVGEVAADARLAPAPALTRAVRSGRPDGERGGPRPGAFYQVQPPSRGGSRVSAPAVQRCLYCPARILSTGAAKTPAAAAGEQAADAEPVTAAGCACGS
ncbi:hypothetical protein M2271_001390 [Streptomyces sp. LBL]|nr:hypothetical protein [Streptomyces sp. LBL]